jgi:hypothetical protein
MKEYARLSHQNRQFLEGDNNTLLAHKENLAEKKRAALKKSVEGIQRMVYDFTIRFTFESRPSRACCQRCKSQKLFINLRENSLF